MLVAKKMTIDLSRFECTCGVTENLMRAQPFFFDEEGGDESRLNFDFACPHQFMQAGFGNVCRECFTACHSVSHV